MSKLPDHVNENRRYWDEMADQWIAEGERAWASRVPYWGIWGVPNEECPMLPEDMTGMTAIELGCGTGYVSAWMARRGANVTAIDNSERQLATARRLASEYHIDIDFLHGNAESVPRADAMFDFEDEPQKSEEMARLALESQWSRTVMKVHADLLARRR